MAGLDPAGPLFNNEDARLRLNQTDAIFVDVLHTNSLPIAGSGLHMPVGDVDIYPHKGGRQAPCNDSGITNKTKTFALNKILIHL